MIIHPIPFTQSELIDMFDYDPLTGVVKNKKRRSNNSWEGMVVGTLDGGYLNVKLEKKMFRLHRVIWKIVYGYDPDQVDHKDGNKLNNSIVNLRDCTHGQNIQNRPSRIGTASGVKGVTYMKPKHSVKAYWFAQIRCNGKMSRKSFEYSDEGLAKAKVWIEDKRNSLHREFSNSTYTGQHT